MKWLLLPAGSMLLSGLRVGLSQGRTHCEVSISQVWPGLQTVRLQPQREVARTTAVVVVVQAGTHRPESGLEVTQDSPG